VTASARLISISLSFLKSLSVRVSETRFLDPRAAAQPFDHLPHECRITGQQPQEFRTRNDDERRFFQHLCVVRIRTAMHRGYITDAIARSADAGDQFLAIRMDHIRFYLAPGHMPCL